MVAHDPQVAGDSSDPWDGRSLVLPAHIHARPPDARRGLPGSLDAPAEAGFELEILLNERSRRAWVLNREPSVSLPLHRCARQSAWGLPTVVPEVILFYKATAYFGLEDIKERPQDKADFVALRPHLDEAQVSWLREAIARVQPAHPWLGYLPRGGANDR
jgi:hypothetical protein